MVVVVVVAVVAVVMKDFGCCCCTACSSYDYYYYYSFGSLCSVLLRMDKNFPQSTTLFLPFRVVHPHILAQ